MDQNPSDKANSGSILVIQSIFRIPRPYILKFFEGWYTQSDNNRNMHKNKGEPAILTKKIWFI